MISRVAESCFWLNRYVERIEVLARMLSVNRTFQLDVDLREPERWTPLVIVTGQEELYAADPQYCDEDPERAQDYLVWNQANPSSVHSSLRAARENARTIRETISLEMWETLNDLWVWMNDRAARRLYGNDRHAFYIHLRDHCLLFHGIAHATLLHEDPFEFMRLGTALERAELTARILDLKHHSIGPTVRGEETALETAQWQTTLRFCSGIEPFFKREDNELSGRMVAAFLLFDRAFPRSVLHNLIRARNFLKLVCPPAPSTVGRQTHALLEACITQLEHTDIDSVLEEGLHEVLTRTVQTITEVCEGIHSELFEPPRSVRSPEREREVRA